ncbi:hypothetical protein C8Q78DRAFT_61236 [Trametes maxima]|nr:hypothetical protein C8Q78DRAFT_61236 [Trametes maxima]
MRVCSASAARVFTFFSLALLSSHSFILANAQAPESGDVASAAETGTAVTAPSSTPALPDPTPSTSSTPASSPPPPTTTPAATTKATTSAPPPDPTTSTSTSAVADTSSSSSKSQSSVSAIPAADTQSSSSASTSASTSSTSTSSSSSSSSTSSTSSSSSRSTTVTQVRQTTTALVVAPTTTGRARTGTDTTSYTWLTSSATATDEAVNRSGAASKGFFDNKGAVAGTFSVVGIVAVGAIIVAILYAKRRAARLQDEEDMTYFEKYPNPHADGYDAHEASFGNDQPGEAEIMTHAAPGAYPDRSTHYGPSGMEEFSQAQPVDYSYTNTAGVGAGAHYPPGTAYARAQAQQGQQYQYDAYGTDYSTAQYQEAYYDTSRHSPSSPSHPYADPRNSPRQDGAPAVQQPYASSHDLGHGEAR